MIEIVIKPPIQSKSPLMKNDIGKIIKMVKPPDKSPDFITSLPKRVEVINEEIKPPTKRQIHEAIAESEFGFGVLIRINGDRSNSNIEIAIPKKLPMSEMIKTFSPDCFGNFLFCAI